MSERLKVGDLVTRGFYDVQRIVIIPDDYDPEGDVADVECLLPALGYLLPDGSRGEGWCKVGDRNTFVISDLSQLCDDAMEPCTTCGLPLAECTQKAVLRLDREERHA